MSYAGKVRINNVDSAVTSSLYGLCTTQSGTAGKIVSLTDFDTLMTGVLITVKFSQANTAASPTLNVNGTGDIPIYTDDWNPPGQSAITSWAPNAIIGFIYDGSAWYMLDNDKYSMLRQTRLLAANYDSTASYEVGDLCTLEGVLYVCNTAIPSSESFNPSHWTATTVANAINNTYTAIRAEIAPDYDASQTYAIGDLVFYKGVLYRCVTAITVAEAWTPAHWEATTIKQEIGTTIKLLNAKAGKDGTATASVSGTGITDATVDVATFETTVSESGTYVFEYNGAAWEYNGGNVSLAAYGISETGTPASGDKITVVYVAGNNPFMPSGTYPEYPFRTTIPMPGVTATMIPEVIFAMADAITGQFAPVAETGADVVYIYAASKPSDEITIPVIVCRG